MKKGLVRISVSEIALRCRLLGVIKEYRRKYPDIRIEISNHLTAQAVESVRDSNADMASVSFQSISLYRFQKIHRHTNSTEIFFRKIPQRNIIIVKKKNRPLSIATSRLEDIILNL